MKDLSTVFRDLRDADRVIETKRKVELIPLGKESTFDSWTNTGRCGNETNVLSLEKHKGDIYAGCSYPVNGHVWRYNKINDWDDMGNPIDPLSSSVMGLLSSDNKLYAGLSYGRMRRFISPGNWENCGQTYSIRLLFEYEGDVCAGVATSPGRIMRWNGGTSWSEIGRLGGNAVRCVHLHTDGKWYGGCSNSGHLYRNDGVLNWTDLGLVDTNVNGIYSLASHKDDLYIGTEMSIIYEDRIYKYNAPSDYTYCGYPGESNIIRCMVDYKDSLLVGTNDKAYVYLYRGGTLWEDISGQLNSESSLWAFEEWDDKIYVGTKSHGQVWVSEAKITPTDISNYVTHVGQITKRLERDLNQFQPSTVPITVNNEDVFIKSDKSGLLDYDNIANGYQVKVYVGLTGSTQWVLMFDGKLDPDSVKMPDRQTVTFDAIGWLDDAKNYNAELVADPSNPPFKNITGVTFASASPETQLGAKSLEYGIETDGRKWLSFDSGGKVYTAEDESIWLFDSVKESSIYLTIDYSKLPEEGQEDNFTIIVSEGIKIACGWWENIPLGTENGIVAKLLTKIGIVDQDIRVQEIEDLIGEEKDFIFMDTVTSVPDGDITAFRVVEVDEPNYIVRALVGITAKTTKKGYVYLFTYTYNTQKCYVKYILEVDDAKRIMRFMKFGDKWWVLISLREKTEPSNYARLSHRALQLTNFDSNWDKDYSYVFGTELPTEYDFVYARSGSVLNASSNDIYFVGQKHTTGVDKAKLFKLTWNGSILSHTLVKLLRTPTTDDACYIDEWASLVPESAETFYYFGIRKNPSPNFLEIRKYALTSDAFTDVKIVDPCTGQIDYFTRNTYSVSYRWQAYFMYHESDVLDKGWWIGATGQLNEEPLDETIKNITYGNPDFINYYSWWHYDADGYYYIKSMHAGVGSVYLEAEKLDEKYSIGECAPEMFKGTLGSWDFAGVVMEEGSKVITPFLYMIGKVPMIQIANFKGMNCEKALTKLSEAFCCCLDIYEHQKARFYYRGSFNDSDTIDYDVYLRQPKKRYWKNWCDGVIVENSEKGIRSRIGTTDFGSRILTGSPIDNVFVSSQGMAKVIAELLYSFYGVKKLVTPISIPFYVEPELMDKITFTLRDKDGNIWRSLGKLIYETSFNVSPGEKATHDMELELLEMTGETLHNKIMTESDAKIVVII